MITSIPVDTGLPVSPSSLGRMVPRFDTPPVVAAPVEAPAAPAPAPVPVPAAVPAIDPAAVVASSGAIQMRGRKPGDHPPVRWGAHEAAADVALGDIVAMQIMSNVARECCFLPVRIEEIDGDGVIVCDVRDTRRWYRARQNYNSAISRARLVAGNQS